MEVEKLKPGRKSWLVLEWEGRSDLSSANASRSTLAGLNIPFPSSYSSVRVKSSIQLVHRYLQAVSLIWQYLQPAQHQVKAASHLPQL
jgi:hypothetical protein